MEPVLWSIKYRPATWKEFFGQKEAIQQLQNHVASTTIPHFIFVGPSGTGKTTAANLFAKEVLGDAYTSNFKLLNVRDIRSYSISDAKRNMSALAKLDRSKRTELDEYMSVVFREAKAARSAKGVSRDPNRSQLLHQAIHLFASTITIADDLVKLLVLDESEALDSNMLQALRRTMEIYSKACRFILVTTSMSGWNPAIASRSMVIKFPALKDEDIEGYLTKIAETENVSIDSLGMNSIIRESGGDMRRAIDILQICAATGKNVTEDLVHKHSDTVLVSGVRTMVSDAISGNYLSARKELRNLLALELYSATEVVVQIQREIAKRPLDGKTMYHLFDRISEIDYRIIQGKNPHIHLMALLASLGRLSETKV